MFLLVPAYPGCPGSKAVKRSSSLLLLFILYASQVILFCSLFLSYLLPYLSFPLRIDPLHFQEGCCKMRLNLALVLVVYFVLWYISFDW